MSTETQLELAGLEEVADEATSAGDEEPDVLPTYTIIAYGADFDVTSLVKRLANKDIEIPNFQRGYIWDYRRASRFIESLLMGFPVPGIFLWRNPETEKLVVVDGQQRLRTLESFYDLVFKGKEFALPERTSPYQVVHPRFQTRTYKTLDDEDRRRLDNSTIHATIVNQERPVEDDSSIYYLFERLNTEGTALQPQEIRSAIYQGPLVELLGVLNGLPEWRSIYGPESSRLKDRELIVRFFALYFDGDNYARPMKEFINTYFRRNRKLATHSQDELTQLFARTISVVNASIGQRAFRPERAINAAVFDAVMVGIARRLAAGPVADLSTVAAAYDELLANEDFVAAFTHATADADNVSKRLRLATDSFSSIR